MGWQRGWYHRTTQWAESHELPRCLVPHGRKSSPGETYSSHPASDPTNESLPACHLDTSLFWIRKSPNPQESHSIQPIAVFRPLLRKGTIVASVLPVAPPRRTG